LLQLILPTRQQLADQFTNQLIGCMASIVFATGATSRLARAGHSYPYWGFLKKANPFCCSWLQSLRAGKVAGKLAVIDFF
jgi:hypothetical protein